MYRTSNDRRFVRNKLALRRAFIDLVIEQGYQSLTVSKLTERADLNRMTFYGHYDAISDVFDEFVADMVAGISEQISLEPEFTLEGFFRILNSFMYEEIDFFRHVANTPAGPDFKTAFKDAIRQLIQIDMGKVEDLTERQKLIICDQIAVCIAFSYLDWLAGDYGDATLDEVVGLTGQLLRGHLPWVSYR